ncbi:hypothetical protein QWY86_15435 [Pedobacter aquatilis]|nr:hypothetical protein [Pedobacter aquatilis]MDN3588075.1 hypothetical protein [Pedobacter aquatilis]
MNLKYPDPDEDAPNDDNGWDTVPSDYNDVIVKGDTPDIGESLGSDDN